VVHILLGIEAGKVSPQNFRSRITLDPLRSAAPSHDMAARIETEYRIVFDHFDQRLESRFACAKFLHLILLVDDCTHTRFLREWIRVGFLRTRRTSRRAEFPGGRREFPTAGEDQLRTPGEPVAR